MATTVAQLEERLGHLEDEVRANTTRVDVMVGRCDALVTEVAGMRTDLRAAATTYAESTTKLIGALAGVRTAEVGQGSAELAAETERTKSRHERVMQPFVVGLFSLLASVVTGFLAWLGMRGSAP